MAYDEQEACTGTMSGTIWMFLSANKFRVELSDGQVVDAVLPDELVDEMRPYYSGPPIAERIGVVVEFRQPPAMHRILEITGNDGWCGAARPARR
jgi:hypothetical protein